jgi:hypothetical protein
MNLKLLTENDLLWTAIGAGIAAIAAHKLYQIHKNEKTLEKVGIKPSKDQDDIADRLREDIAPLGAIVSDNRTQR